MNLKIKSRTEKIGKFLREIVVVTIGVAITLSATYCISNRNAKKDMILYLNAIKLELEENERNIKEANSTLIQTALNYSDYLRSHDKQSLDLDTLVFYRTHTVFNIYSIPIKTNAFEMFKTSGNMLMIKNKENLLALWDIYGQLNDFGHAIEQSQQMKLEEIKKFFYQNSLPDEVLLKDPPMYDFYVNMYATTVQRSASTYILNQLNEAISMLENTKRLK